MEEYPPKPDDELVPSGEESVPSEEPIVIKEPPFGSEEFNPDDPACWCWCWCWRTNELPPSAEGETMVTLEATATPLANNPEPSTLVLFALGAMGTLVVMRKRSRAGVP